MRAGHAIYYGLATVLFALQTARGWIERRGNAVDRTSRFLLVCAALLTLIFAGLTYDAAVTR